MIYRADNVAPPDSSNGGSAHCGREVCDGFGGPTGPGNL